MLDVAFAEPMLKRKRKRWARMMAGSAWMRAATSWKLIAEAVRAAGLIKAGARAQTRQASAFDRRASH